MNHSFCNKNMLIFMFFLNVSIWSQQQEIKIYTYHTHAPFIIGDSIGLTYDLAEYLTAKSDNRYIFTVQSMSKTRVEKSFDNEEAFIVPWVNPIWFDDEDEESYTWTEHAIMEDGNAVISSSENQINYSGAASVSGLRFGGIIGHRYIDIDDLADQGEIVRFNNENHVNNFRMLQKNRIDFTIAPLVGAEYIIQVNRMSDDLYISPILHSEYLRKFIISHNDEEIVRFLDSLLLHIQEDPSWIAIISKYR